MNGADPHTRKCVLDSSEKLIREGCTEIVLSPFIRLVRHTIIKSMGPQASLLRTLTTLQRNTCRLQYGAGTPEFIVV